MITTGLVASLIYSSTSQNAMIPPYSFRECKMSFWKPSTASSRSPTVRASLSP